MRLSLHINELESLPEELGLLCHMEALCATLLFVIPASCGRAQSFAPPVCLIE